MEQRRDSVMPWSSLPQVHLFHLRSNAKYSRLSASAAVRSRIFPAGASANYFADICVHLLTKVIQHKTYTAYISLASMADLFSTPAEHAFEHDEIEQAIAGPSSMGDATVDLTVEQAFEVEDTIRRIRDGGYKTVRFDSAAADTIGICGCRS